MLGAIIGDIVGSIYEFNNIKTKDFPLWSNGTTYTDDSIMSIAVAKALLVSNGSLPVFHDELITQMQSFGKKYPHPCGGYGARFSGWLFSDEPQPYNSFGNGSAMRVSACGFAASSLDEALVLAKYSSEVTHNHPEGIKGAQATAAAIYLARIGKTKDDIKQYIEDNFYALHMSIDEIRPIYSFNETCQETVPQAIQAFIESTSFEDAIRNAISIGGDSDTLTAITGAIAEAFYGIPDGIREKAISYLPDDLMSVVEEFEKKYK